MNFISLYKRLYRELFYIYNKRKFNELEGKVRVFNPLVITGKEYITIAKNVTLSNNIYLAATKQTGNIPKIIIGEGTRLGNFNHIYATKSIIIEKNVLTAERVYISDNLHSYEDITTPILKQPIKQVSEVLIGEGCWLGENVCVIGSSIGKNCVVGANSVVTKDIPDYSVAVGIPAKVIKTYNSETNKWEKV